MKLREKLPDDRLTSFEYNQGHSDIRHNRLDVRKGITPNSLDYEQGVKDCLSEKKYKEDGLNISKPLPRYYIIILENGKFDSSKGNMSPMVIVVEKIVNKKVEKKFIPIKWEISGPIEIGRRIRSKNPNKDGYRASFIIKVIGCDTLYVVAEEPEKKKSWLKKNV